MSLLISLWLYRATGAARYVRRGGDSPIAVLRSLWSFARYAGRWL